MKSDDLARAMADLVKEDVAVHKKFEKDVVPHFIRHTIEMDETVLASPPEPLTDILKRLDEQEIREDVFVNAINLTYQTLQDRLRHRATMMRRRADEFDDKADEIEKRITTIRSMVETTMDHISGTDKLLAEHAHIEPEVVK